LTKRVASAAIATGVATAILVSLGVWQLHRLRWKEGILAQIAAAERAPPVTLQPGTKPPEFARVRLSGTLRGGKAALFGAEVRGDRLGAQEIEVLDRTDGPPVLVDLGWVASYPVVPAPLSGQRDIVGYIRKGETPNFLSAADDMEGRRFYTLQPALIGRTLGAPDAEPFVVVALNVGDKPPVNGDPEPATTLPRPPNNHLNYAFTWFGLACALLAIFAVWVRSKPDRPA
jgi:surfeit locus 1 family protein